jgi:hypothetical protein
MSIALTASSRLPRSFAIISSLIAFATFPRVLAAVADGDTGCVYREWR